MKFKKQPKYILKYYIKKKRFIADWYMLKFRFNAWWNNFLAMYYPEVWREDIEKSVTPPNMELKVTYVIQRCDWLFGLSNHYLTMYEIYRDKSYYLKKAVRRWYE